MHKSAITEIHKFSDEIASMELLMALLKFHYRRSIICNGYCTDLGHGQCTVF